MRGGADPSFSHRKKHPHNKQALTPPLPAVNKIEICTLPLSFESPTTNRPMHSSITFVLSSLCGISRITPPSFASSPTCKTHTSLSSAYTSLNSVHSPSHTSTSRDYYPPTRTASPTTSATKSRSCHRLRSSGSRQTRTAPPRRCDK